MADDWRAKYEALAYWFKDAERRASSETARLKADADRLFSHAATAREALQDLQERHEALVARHQEATEALSIAKKALADHFQKLLSLEVKFEEINSLWSDRQDAYAKALEIALARWSCRALLRSAASEWVSFPSDIRPIVSKIGCRLIARRDNNTNTTTTATTTTTTTATANITNSASLPNLTGKKDQLFITPPPLVQPVIAPIVPSEENNPQAASRRVVPHRPGVLEALLAKGITEQSPRLKPIDKLNVTSASVAQLATWEAEIRQELLNRRNAKGGSARQSAAKSPRGTRVSSAVESPSSSSCSTGGGAAKKKRRSRRAGTEEDHEGGSSSTVVPPVPVITRSNNKSPVSRNDTSGAAGSTTTTSGNATPTTPNATPNLPSTIATPTATSATATKGRTQRTRERRPARNMSRTRPKRDASRVPASPKQRLTGRIGPVTTIIDDNNKEHPHQLITSYTQQRPPFLRGQHVFSTSALMAPWGEQNNRRSLDSSNDMQQQTAVCPTRQPTTETLPSRVSVPIAPGRRDGGSTTTTTTTTFQSELWDGGRVYSRREFSSGPVVVFPPNMLSYRSLAGSSFATPSVPIHQTINRHMTCPVDTNNAPETGNFRCFHRRSLRGKSAAPPLSPAIVSARHTNNTRWPIQQAEATTTHTIRGFNNTNTNGNPTTSSPASRPPA